MKQISDGLIAEAKFQLLQAMGKVNTQELVLEAQANIAKTWQELFAHPKVTDPNQPLEKGLKKDENGKLVEDENGKLIPIGLKDPKYPVNAVILFIYQMNNFCFKELNRSSRFKDESKVNTLGPWAAALYEIVDNA